MSHAATNWAIQQRGLKPTTKIVLWHLCDRFNPDHGCFPAQDRLAHDCEISRANLNTHLGLLEQQGLLRRERRIDPSTKRQLSTRYILAFEAAFTSSAPDSTLEGPLSRECDGPNPCPDSGHGSDQDNPSKNNALPRQFAENPCPDLRHGAVSRNQVDPCPEKRQSRVQNLDTNLVREPLSKPVKEEEDAQARDADFNRFFAELIAVLGLDPAALPGWWQGWPPRLHVQRWRTELGLTEAEIVSAAKDTRQDHPEPPDGPKALDRAMQRAAQRKTDDAGRKRRKRKPPLGPAVKPPLSDDEKAAFYAKMVNSEGYLPDSVISNTIRDAMLVRGLVTPERLRMRGVR